MKWGPIDPKDNRRVKHISGDENLNLKQTVRRLSEKKNM